MAFGQSAPTTGVFSANLQLNEPTYAFTVAENATINAMAFSFNTIGPLSLVGSEMNVYANIYVAPKDSNTFSLHSNGKMLIGSFTDLVAIGTYKNNIKSNLNIPLHAGDRVLVVISAESTGLTLISAIAGYVSGGISLGAVATTPPL